MADRPVPAYTALPRELRTERLVLTPQVESDVAWLAELFNERGDRHYSDDETRERIRAQSALLATIGIGALAVRVAATSTPVGYVALVVGRATPEEPELAYELLPRAQGHGYCTEAALALVEAAFGTGRTRLWSTVRAWNEPSLRVLGRVGFRRDHTTSDDRGEIVWHVRDAA